MTLCVVRWKRTYADNTGAVQAGVASVGFVGPGDVRSADQALPHHVRVANVFISGGRAADVIGANKQQRNRGAQYTRRQSGRRRHGVASSISVVRAPN